MGVGVRIGISLADYLETLVPEHEVLLPAQSNPTIKTFKLVTMTISQGALPCGCDPPTGSYELKLVAMVPCPVSKKLLLPERSTGLRQSKIRTILMGMPEASLDLYHHPVTGQDYVWSTRQSAIVKHVSVTKTMEEPPDHHFRRSVGCPNS